MFCLLLVGSPARVHLLEKQRHASPDPTALALGTLSIGYPTPQTLKSSTLLKLSGRVALNKQRTHNVSVFETP